MDFSLRLDTLGLLEVRYLRGRERYRDWPPFLMLAASRQARVLAYLNRDVIEELHQQILAVEEAAGLVGNDDYDEDEDGDEESESEESTETGKAPSKETEGGTGLSPAFAQALEKLNDLARQRLPEGSNPVSEELSSLRDAAFHGAGHEDEEEDALEQLQDAFVQMMEVVRELAEELSTDALKLTGRLRCARTEVFFTQAETGDEDEDEDEDDEDEDEDGQITLALVLRLYEEGHTRPDDLPAVELQLDVDDFERLHETLDIAIDRERRSRRRH